LSEGSCIEGGVGAAAILYRNGVEEKAEPYLGTGQEHTVFEADLAEAAMGEKLLSMEREAKYTLVMDNQGDIQTTRKEKAISGQYLINALHRQIEGITTQQPGLKVFMRWTPGDVGIPGN
jgi:hypothetical protein